MMKKLIIMLSILIVSSTVLAAPTRNATALAPEISPIALNGDLSDWDDSSGWLDFGMWYGEVLLPARAQYAWNDAADVMYLGIEYLGSDMTGVQISSQGNLAFPDQPHNVSSDGLAVQIMIENGSGSPLDTINNQTRPGMLGNTAYGFSVNGPVTTLEYQQSFYMDWGTTADVVELSALQLVYMNVDLFDLPNWTPSSCQTTDSFVNLFAAMVPDEATAITLVPEPATMLLLGLGGLLIRRKN